MIFGLPASKAATIELQIKEDKETVKEIFTEIGLPNDADSMDSLARINPNPSRTTPNPPPLRMTQIDFSYSFTSIENVLSAAKKLKGSEKFNKVFINKDLTTVEIVQLKQLIAPRNDLNIKLEESNGTSSTIATYQYGIRNDRVVKVALPKN
jgi:type II secretory pathway component HofQ